MWTLVIPADEDTDWDCFVLAVDCVVEAELGVLLVVVFALGGGEVEVAVAAADALVVLVCVLGCSIYTLTAVLASWGFNYLKLTNSGFSNELNDRSYDSSLCGSCLTNCNLKWNEMAAFREFLKFCCGKEKPNGKKKKD